MARITDLATELLQQIWSLIPIEDIYNFSISCHVVCKAGSKYIRSQKGPIKSTGVSLLSALCAINKEPIIAEYVDEIVVEGLCDRWSKSPDKQELARFGATVAALDTLEQVIARCPYLSTGPTPRSRRAEIVPWALAIQWGGEYPILSLLLTMLPKVRTFRLHGAANQVWPETISQIAADPTAVALSHLSLIDLNLDSQMETRGFRMLATLARVPSLVKLQVKNVYEPEGEHIGDLHLQANTSNVAELSLKNQDTCWESLGAFLGVFRALRRFVYQPCDPPDLDGLKSVEPEFYPSNIVTVLLEHARNTLEHLTLYAGSRRLAYMGSLRGFSVLTSLHTEWQLLIDDASSSQTLLADSLPGSIQQIQMKVDPSFDLETGSALIEHLVSIRETRFSPLASIKLLHMTEENARGLLGKTFVVEAKNVGITIDCDISENPDTTSRTLLEAMKAYDVDPYHFSGKIGRFFKRPGGVLA